ncbi:MAG: ChaN family lipoprotein [Pseudomonadota bacterium]
MVKTRLGLACFVVLVAALVGARAHAAKSAVGAELIDQLCRVFVPAMVTAPKAKRHPLIGTVWAPRINERVASGRVLVQLMRSTDYLLLGEIHDNPIHHQIQACLLDFASEGRKLSVVFEQIRSTQADALATYLALPDATASGLGPAINWGKSGWPQWSEYQPIADVALRRKLPILAGDVARDAMRAVARRGLDGVPAQDRDRLGVAVPLPDRLEAALRKELAESHCNLMPSTAFGGMSIAQRYRDAHLADALLTARKTRAGAVLISGNGHVRSDRGVPWHLSRREPETTTLTIAQAEVQDDVTDPAAYVPKAPDGTPAVDLVIFTERAVRPDQCEELRKRFQKPADDKAK